MFNFSVKIHPDLHEAAKEQAETIGYSSLSAYIKGLIRHDILLKTDHTLPLSIENNLNGTGIYKLDQQLLQKMKGTEPAPCPICEPKAQHKKK